VIRVCYFSIVFAWLTGCAWQPGTGFATVHADGVVLRAALGAGRQDAQGRWKLSDGSKVAEFKAVLTVKDCVLESLSESGGGGGGTFDPANPPPGYTLCHGGHCHRADGALIDEAQIRAELQAKAGVSTYASALTLLPAEPRWDLAWKAERATTWQTMQPHPYLAQVSLKRASLRLTQLDLQGVTSTDTVPGDRSWRMTLPLDGVTFSAPLSTTVSRAGPAAYGLSASFRLSDRLLDGLPWQTWFAQPTTADTFTITPEGEVLTSLKERFLASTWTVQLTPKPAP
jgi:hypothetical protein